MRLISILFSFFLATTVNAEETERWHAHNSALVSCYDTYVALVSSGYGSDMSDLSGVTAEAQIPSPSSAFALWTNLHNFQSKVENLHLKGYITDNTLENTNAIILEIWTTTRAALLRRRSNFDSDSSDKLFNLADTFSRETCPNLHYEN